MTNITDAPPRTGHLTDRDRVSLLEIVGVAALSGTLVWPVTALLGSAALAHTNPLLNPFGIWLAGSVAWATIVCLVVREFRRISAYAWAAFAGAALPAVLHGLLLTRNPGEIIATTIPVSIAMAIVNLGTVVLVAAPRKVRGLMAIAGYLLLLVYYTAAFGQAFVGFLRGS